MLGGTSANRRIYIDTNLLFYYLVQEVLRTDAPEAYKEGVESFGQYSEYRSNAELAGTILDKINSSAYDGVISALAFLELRKKLRAFLCRHTKLDMIGIEAIVAKSFEVLWQIQGWYSPELQHKDELDEDRAQLLWHEVLVRANEIHKANVGERDSRIPIKHVGTKTVDALHIALAEGFGCRYLVTFDADFVTARKQCSLDVQIVHLPHEVHVLRSRY